MKNKKIISNRPESFSPRHSVKWGEGKLTAPILFTAPPLSGGLTYNNMRSHIYTGLGGRGGVERGHNINIYDLHISFRANLLALSRSLSPPLSPRNYQTTGNTLCRPLVHINSTTYNPYVSCFILFSPRSHTHHHHAS